MAIDKAIFAAGMGLLANNFNKTVDAALSRVWYGVLSAQLTTAEFERAVQQSITEDTFWPTAASLVAKVKVESPATQGAAALEHVNRVLSQYGGHRFLPHDQYRAAFDAPTRAAIAAVGGLAEITGCSVERWGSLAKKFTAAYVAALETPKQIEPPATDALAVRMIHGIASARSLPPSTRDRQVGPDA